MLVSSFELLFKPLSPFGPFASESIPLPGITVDVPEQLPVPRTLQGYFLSITNLENQTYEFMLDFAAQKTVSANRNLDGNATYIIDVPGSNNAVISTLAPTANPSLYRLQENIIIPPRVTALVALIPSVFSPNALTQNENFEVRGYVTLHVPVIYPENSISILRGRAQGQNPVSVLLTAQNRTTYYTDAQGRDVISGTTQSSLPLASGGSLNEIQPEQPFIFPFPDDFEIDPGVFERLIPFLEGIAPEERSAALVTLLAQVDPEADTDRINGILKQNDIAFRLTSD